MNIEYFTLPRHCAEARPTPDRFVDRIKGLTVAGQNMAGRWLRLTAKDQRTLLGFAVFGRLAFKVEGDKVLVGRSVCFGQDFEVCEYTACDIEYAARNRLVIRPGCCGEGIFNGIPAELAGEHRSDLGVTIYAAPTTAKESGTPAASSEPADVKTPATDQQRHAEKIATFCAAVERAGFAAVEHMIGGPAAGKLELARDAARRQQPLDIIAGYLADAQVRFDLIAGEDCPDLYETLANIALPAVQAGSVVLTESSERKFSFYFSRKFVGAITASCAEEALSKATEQAVSRRFAPQKPLAEVQALCEVRAASRNFY